MKWKAYKESGMTNKGMAEILYEWNYKHTCVKPVKLDLFPFGKKIGALQAEFIHTGDIRDPFPELPESYCLKPVDGAGARGVFLMHKGINLKDGTAYTEDGLREKYIEQAKQYVGYSLNYFVEELLLNGDDIPDDISFFMVEDNVGGILQAKRLGKGKGKVFYDGDWNVIGSKGIPRVKPSPDLQNDMTGMAKLVMRELGVPCMRVDFYPVEGRGAFLGELTAASGTFTPQPSVSFTGVPGGIMVDSYCGWLLQNVDTDRYNSEWRLK